jgi:hypothetical protein
MSDRILLCRNCGAKNRIPNKKNTTKIVCGSCRYEITAGDNKSAVLPTLAAVILKLWFVWVLALIAILTTNFSDNSKAPSYTYQEQLPANQFFSAPQVQIAHGILTKNFNFGVAPLEIKTRAGNNYYIKIIDTSTNKTALTAYIVGGLSFETKMPLGTYEIRYAAGDTWYGTDYYFGPDTAFSKATELFDFTFDGYQYAGYVVELILQTNGNLETTDINQSDF